MTYTCQKCGWTWKPRPRSLESGRTKPVRCPNQRCQTQSWEKQ